MIYGICAPLVRFKIWERLHSSTRHVEEALSLPLRRSRLGSLSEGAGSPNGLTEGVSFDEWCNPMVLHSLL